MADNNSSSTVKMTVAALGAIAAIAPVAMNYLNSSPASTPSAAPAAVSTPAQSVATPPAPDRVPQREPPVVLTPDPITVQRSEVRRGRALPGEPTSAETSRAPSHSVGSVRLFAEARAFARERRFLSQAEWDEFAASGAKPADIPANPAAAYRDQGWMSWNDWLGIR